MSAPWVMTASQDDALVEDAVHSQADEEQHPEESGPDGDFRDGSRRLVSGCHSRSRSPCSQSSAGPAPSQVEDTELIEQKSEQGPPSSCLPERHNIFSDADEKIPSVSRLGPLCLDRQAEDSCAESRPHGPGHTSASGPRPDSLATPARLRCVPLGLAVLSVCLAALAPYAGRPAEEAASPADIMLMHSAKHLSLAEGASTATVGALQDKLQLKQMQVDLDTQVFVAKREAAKDLIESLCNLPEKVCKSMAGAVGTRDMKFHKKSSAPLDSNKGSYFGVWMWVKEMGGEGDIQVAFKAASLSYQLRDVVTYRDQIDDEPVIKCETLTNNLWFMRGTKEHCREVARKRTVTPLPVFQQSVMSSEEMQLVDTLMESMLAKKVLEDASVDIPRLLRTGAAPRPALEGER